MAEKIDGYGRAGLDVRPSRTRAVAPADRPGNTDSTQKNAAARDAVQLTDTATKLKAIEASLASVPEVDRGRVEALRQQIESGRYQPDANSVAQKLLRMEQDLS